MSSPVAVIDIGSNTIKLLVAAPDAAGGVATVHFAVEEARISRGIAAAQPMLQADSMERGAAAVRALLAVAAPFAPKKTALVATSAVRDAGNGAEFIGRVKRETGHSIRLLSGDEEAAYIARGLAADPALAGAKDFYSFDLGGGSLECLEFRAGRVAQGVSYRLGCVRLTERCVADSSAPFTAGDREKVAGVVRSAFETGTFRFTLTPPVSAVGTGGTVATSRAVLAAQTGANAPPRSAVISVAELEQLFALAASRPLAERRKLPGLPPERADVFPTALATMLEVARLSGATSFVHSLYNLRYGIAAELLAD